MRCSRSASTRPCGLSAKPSRTERTVLYQGPSAGGCSGGGCLQLEEISKRATTARSRQLAAADGGVTRYCGAVPALSRSSREPASYRTALEAVPVLGVSMGRVNGPNLTLCHLVLKVAPEPEVPSEIGSTHLRWSTVRRHGGDFHAGRSIAQRAPTH